MEMDEILLVLVILHDPHLLITVCTVLNVDFSFAGLYCCHILVPVLFVFQRNQF